jgi:hypothetical protein
MQIDITLKINRLPIGSPIPNEIEVYLNSNKINTQSRSYKSIELYYQVDFKCTVLFIKSIFFSKLESIINSFSPHENNEIKYNMTFYHLIETARTNRKKHDFDDFKNYIDKVAMLL